MDVGNDDGCDDDNDDDGNRGNDDDDDIKASVCMCQKLLGVYCML